MSNPHAEHRDRISVIMWTDDNLLLDLVLICHDLYYEHVVLLVEFSYSL